jgi:hypothetical protein
MTENDEIDRTGTFAPDDYLSSRTGLLKAVSEFERGPEQPDRSGETPKLTIDSLIKTSWKKRVLNSFKEVEEFGATSAIKIYKFVRTRVSWKQRVLSWFRAK